MTEPTKIKILKTLAKDWWKYVVIIMVAGIALSAIKCPTPWGEFEKSKPKIFEKEKK